MDDSTDQPGAEEAFLNSIKKEAVFATTHWSVVSQLHGSDPARAAAALEQLCRTYWYPIYAFIRRNGSNHHDAQDRTQAFFHFLLEKAALGKANPQKGKFRSFLLGSLSNFLSNERAGRQTIKRGGGHQIVSLDETLAEKMYGAEPADPATPETAFDRQWARTLLGKALAGLKQEYAQKGQGRLLATIVPALTGEPPPGQYDEWATALGINQQAIAVAVHRLRRRYGDLLCQEVAGTVPDPTDIAAIKEEIHYLRAILAT